MQNNQNNNNLSLRNRVNSTWLEIIAFIIVIVVANNVYYLLAASYSLHHHADYGYILELPIDRTFPFFPLFIIPYLFTWIYPVLAIIYLGYKMEPINPLGMRRVGVAILTLVLINFLLYLIFPTHYPYRVASSCLQSGGFLDKLVAYTYLYVPNHNTCPSTHVSMPWLIYRLSTFYLPKDRVLRSLQCLLILTIFSIVAIKIHFILDILGGILVAEVVFQLVLKQLEFRQSFADIQPKHFAGYFSMMVVVLSLFYIFMSHQVR